jgi:hypothetical protein
MLGIEPKASYMLNVALPLSYTPAYHITHFIGSISFSFFLIGNSLFLVDIGFKLWVSHLLGK